VNEHNFIKAVHRYLPSELFRWKIHDTYAGGVPDAFYLGPASALFIEYKYVKKLPARPTTILRTSLSKQQELWLNRLHDCSFPGWYVIGAEDRCIIVKDTQRVITTARFLRDCISFKEAACQIYAFVQGEGNE
jgi:hypothetical protein